jgi:hypothetical protein
VLVGVILQRAPDGGIALLSKRPRPHFIAEVETAQLANESGSTKRTSFAFVQKISIPLSLAKPLRISVRAVKLVTRFVEFELACLRRL